MSWFFVLYRSKWAPQDETPAGIQLQAEDENQAQQHCLDALPSAVVLGGLHSAHLPGGAGRTLFNRRLSWAPI